MAASVAASVVAAGAGVCTGAGAGAGAGACASDGLKNDRHDVNAPRTMESKADSRRWDG